MDGADEPLSNDLLEYYRIAYQHLFDVVRARDINPIYINTDISDLKLWL